MSESTIEFTGGARIGAINATWPFATLIATPEYIEIKAPIIGSRKYSASEVKCLERHRGLISKGVRIFSSNNNDRVKVVFWCFGNPQKIIDQITEIGFIPSGGATNA